MEERQLIQSAQNGDLNDFRLLMERHSQLIWRVMKALVADPARVEDGVQDAWVEVWRKLPDFSGDDPLRSWLLTITASCAKRYMRSQPLTFLEPYLSYERGRKDPATPQAASRGFDMDAILKRLPTQQSRVLKLHCYAGLDLAEIALVLRMPLKEVKACRQRAFHSLKALFAEDHAMKRQLKQRMEMKND